MTKQILKNQVEELRRGAPAKPTVRSYEYMVAAGVGLVIGLISSIWI